MSTTSSPKKKSSANARKGSLVEAVVAMLHDLPGVKVERNVQLPPVHGDQTRRREIDVLLTGIVAGYPVRIAFSCKNERQKIKPGAIGEFIDELNDVGIPLQQAFFVCVNGYTSGALDRAKETGVRTLVLKGLTKDRLTSEVADAFQFNVNLLAEVTSVAVTNNVGSYGFEGQFFLFFDKERKPCGTVLDLVVSWWQSCDASISLGEHQIDLEVPQGWTQLVDGKPEPVLAISATVQVRGLIITLSGKVMRHALLDARMKRIERSQIRVEFDIPRKRKIVLPLKAVNTEDELKAFMLRPSSARVLSRAKLPRILYGAFYYPWSERVARLYQERFRGFEAGEIIDPRGFTLAETEGTDLSTAWEPAWYETTERDYIPPVIVTDDEGNRIDVRLLMEAEEYARVVALHPRFTRSPTPEFAYLLYWAYLMQGNQLFKKARTKSGQLATRMMEEGIERIKTAIDLNPALPDGYVNLGASLRRLGRGQEALAAYDKAIDMKNDDYEPLANRANLLVELNRFDEALDDITKSIEYAPKGQLQVRPYLIRAYIHQKAEQNAAAANDLVTAWQIYPDEVVEDVEHRPFIEFLCQVTQSPETILLLTELYSQEAAEEVRNGAEENAKRKATQAISTLSTIKPLTNRDQTLIPGPMSHQMAYDTLTRSAACLVKSGDSSLAKYSIEKMQAWASRIFGDDFDSLTNLMRDLS